MSDHLSKNSLFNSDQHLTEEGIAAYTEVLLDGKDENALPEVKAHVDNCEACRREVVELYGLMATMPSETEREEPEQEDNEKPETPKKPSGMHPAWRWGLVTLTALLAFLLYRNSQQTTAPPAPQHNTPTPGQLLNPGQSDRPVAKTEQSEQTTPKTQQPDLYAANFEPSGQFEGLVGETVRGGDVIVLKPTDSQTFKPGSAVRFQWAMETSESLQLILFDNTGKELLRKETTAGSFTWTSPRRPGLYYWKLENTEELLHVGKFFLK